MSDDWLQLIPTDPEYQPTVQAAEVARSQLIAFLPKADAVAAQFESSVKFFHPGGNWSGVWCPECEANIEAWWETAMQAACAAGFADLTSKAPCCGASVSLNNLRYVWPAGFGRFVLEAMNPNVADLQPGDEAALRATLGCDLRKIWLHL